MELPQFLRSKATEFIDYKISLKQNSNYNIRSEEVGLFHQNTDYESKIKGYMTQGKVSDAKKLYKELLDKFSSDLDRGVAIKLVTMLEKITSIIKNQLQGYDQEVLLKTEFERFDEIIEERRLTPGKITGNESGINFFQNDKNEEKAVQPTKKMLPKINPAELPTRKIIKKKNRIIAIRPKIIKKKPIEQQLIDQALKKPLQHQETEEHIKIPPHYQKIQFIDEETNDLLNNINIAKENIEIAIRNQDINNAVETYKILRELFYMIPDEAKDVKSELFSDMLSINLRVHILAKEINRVRTNLIDKEKYKRTIEKLLSLKKEKTLLEEGLYKHERTEQIQNETQTNVYETQLPELSIENYQEEYPDSIIKGESEVEKLRRLAKINRLQHDKNLEQEFPKVGKKSKTFLSIKPKLDDRKTNNIILKPQVNKIDKQMLIKDLYAKGIRNIFEKDKEKAKTYFQRILQINPNYKPALIRLEQIS